MVEIIFHYVLVRKDLPFGVALAQSVHAAGESAQNVTLTLNTHVVVLACPDEVSLLAAEEKLLRNGIEFVSIREPDVPYLGAITAIGIKPQPRKVLRKLLSYLPLYT